MFARTCLTGIAGTRVGLGRVIARHTRLFTWFVARLIRPVDRESDNVRAGGADRIVRALQHGANASRGQGWALGKFRG